MLTTLALILAFIAIIIATRAQFERERTAVELKSAEARALAYRARLFKVEAHLQDLATLTGHRIVTRGAEIVCVVRKAKG